MFDTTSLGASKAGSGARAEAGVEVDPGVGAVTSFGVSLGAG